jgi:hypothetical protein
LYRSVSNRAPASAQLEGSIPGATVGVGVLGGCVGVGAGGGGGCGCVVGCGVGDGGEVAGGLDVGMGVEVALGADGEGSGVNVALGGGRESVGPGVSGTGVEVASGAGGGLSAREDVLAMFTGVLLRTGEVGTAVSLDRGMALGVGGGGRDTGGVRVRLRTVVLVGVSMCAGPETLACVGVRRTIGVRANGDVQRHAIVHPRRNISMDAGAANNQFLA